MDITRYDAVADGAMVPMENGNWLFAEEIIPRISDLEVGRNKLQARVIELAENEAAISADLNEARERIADLESQLHTKDVQFDAYDFAVARIAELEAEIAKLEAEISELEAEISERRLDYTEDCKRLDAAINDLEHQLAAKEEELRLNDESWEIHYKDCREELGDLQRQLAAANAEIERLSAELAPLGLSAPFIVKEAEHD